MLVKIDDALIAAHQWVVDASQKNSAWWMRVTLNVVALAVIVQFALKPDKFVYAALTILFCTTMYVISFRPLEVAKVGAWDLNRRLLLVVTVLVSVRNYFNYEGLYLACDTLSSAATMSCIYFAACKPPKPRVPRFVPQSV